MYERILVATDGSDLSEKAVRSAIELAAATRAELIVLHVVPRYPMSYFEGTARISAAEMVRTEQSWTEHGQAMVDRVRGEAQAAGVQATGALAHSDEVAEAIMAAAKKHGCDLVVMASHGRRGIKRVLLGSETQHVLTHSDVPVLVLR
jgi:nucleotide-binding universal stress UspA family protein